MIGDICSQLGQGQLKWDSNDRDGEFSGRQVVRKNIGNVQYTKYCRSFNYFHSGILTKAPFDRRHLQSFRTRAINMGFK